MSSVFYATAFVAPTPNVRSYEVKIEVRFHELEASWALQSHAERQVHVQLSRFGPELASVVVRLASMRGVDGSNLTHCRVTVRGARLRSITLAEQGDDPVARLTTLLERTGREVGRELDEVRSGLLRGKS